MPAEIEKLVLESFARACAAPAYMKILHGAAVRPDTVSSLDSFRHKVPYIDKAGTFGRFALPELCLEGNLGRPISFLTSSGHSGLFSFGLAHEGDTQALMETTDVALEQFFQVQEKNTLLINGLPMGVKFATRSCALAETSVRPDMILALVSTLRNAFDQIILVGETSFIKHVLESGVGQGIPWREILVHIITGEEPIAVNAAIYLENLLGVDIRRGETGLVVSSMGVAELGLNLFFEAPPLNAMRRALHLNVGLREGVLGPGKNHVPMLFTYDPLRIFPEVDAEGFLAVTTLDALRRLPLIRYLTGDRARIIEDEVTRALLAQSVGIPPEAMKGVPLVLVYGRDTGCAAGNGVIYPEPVKEALYADPEVVSRLTGNFRLRPEEGHALIRVQCQPGVAALPALEAAIQKQTQYYLPGLSHRVRCEVYELFGDGMTLDFERKFAYLD